jgi:hypothetical protein
LVEERNPHEALVLRFASMAPPATPYWMLIAVLQSTVPLAEALAMRLYHAALDLHERQEGKTALAGDLATGEVRRLGEDLLVGSIGGPGFEADLDTPRGKGHVRYVLTREALDAAARARAAPAERDAPLN